jgi:hypothetical protein
MSFAWEIEDNIAWMLIRLAALSDGYQEDWATSILHDPVRNATDE